MKKISSLTVCNLLLLYFCVSCVRLGNHNTNIHVSESENYYELSAQFNQKKTMDVDEYMDYKIGKRNGMTFENSKIDGQITLDDHTVFYIRKYPGYLKIKLDKDKNSLAAYHQIKTMCEGIKNVLAKND